MERLPKWCITDRFPALYDVDSATAIEQTAKVYGAMNTLVDEYNKMVDGVNKEIEDFEAGQITDYELFKIAIRQEFQDFIDTIDLKMKDVTSYMKDNLRETCAGILDELSRDAKTALASITEIRTRVEEMLTTQNQTISTQNSLIAGAIKELDTRLTTQDKTIADAVTYMKDNLATEIENTVTEMIANGSIVMGLSHDAETEELSMHARNIVYASDLSLEYDEASEMIRINEN